MIGFRSLVLVQSPPRDERDSSERDDGEDAATEELPPAPEPHLDLRPSPDPDTPAPLAGLAARFR